MTPSDLKSKLRTEMLDQRNQMSKSKKRVADQLICDKLLKIIIERDIRIMHTYLPMKSEVNVIPLIKKAMVHGVTVVVSKTLKKRQLENLILTDLNNMEPGVFGTYHPKDAEIYNGNYDLIIVAGLAFSKNLYRVGYGGGYYDTFLADQNDALKIGVGYDFQMVDEVPIEEHDIQLDEMITN